MTGKFIFKTVKSVNCVNCVISLIFGTVRLGGAFNWCAAGMAEGSWDPMGHLGPMRNDHPSPEMWRGSVSSDTKVAGHVAAGHRHGDRTSRTAWGQDMVDTLTV